MCDLCTHIPQAIVGAAALAPTAGLYWRRHKAIRVIGTIVLLVLLVGVLGEQVFGKETPQARPQPRADVTLAPIPREHKHGRWVMSESGHATFCWGPTIKLGGFPDGMPKLFATDCETGGLVPLHD